MRLYVCLSVSECVPITNFKESSFFRERRKWTETLSDFDVFSVVKKWGEAEKCIHKIQKTQFSSENIRIKRGVSKKGV